MSATPALHATPAQARAFDAWIAATALGMDTTEPLAALERLTPARPLGMEPQSYVARLLPANADEASALFGGAA